MKANGMTAAVAMAVVAVVVVSLSTPLNGNESLLSQPHDVRLIADWQRVEALLVATTKKIRYEGYARTPWGVCTNLALTTDPDRLKTRNVAQFFFATGGSTFTSQLEAMMKLAGEGTGSSCEASVTCKASASLLTSADEILMDGSCGLGPLPAARFSASLALPFSFSQSIPVELPNPSFGASEQSEISFGRIGPDGEWIDQGRKKIVDTTARSIGLAGTPALNMETDSPDVNSSLRRENHYLAFDLFAARRALLPERDRGTFIKTIRADQVLASDELAAIDISPTLFFKRFADGTMSGLFGELLPIRIRYSRSISATKWLNAEVVINDGAVRMMEIKGSRKVVVVDFISSAGPRLWLSSSPFFDGATLGVRKMKVEMVFDPFLNNGRFGLELDQFEASFQCAKKLPELGTCIFTAPLREAIKTTLPRFDLGSIDSRVQISFPDCLLIGPESTPIDAARPCPAYNQRVGGLMSSKPAGGFQSILTLDLSKSSIRIEKGDLVMAFKEK